MHVVCLLGATRFCLHVSGPANRSDQFGSHRFCDRRIGGGVIRAGTHDGESDEAGCLISIGDVWNLWVHAQPDVSRFVRGLDRVGAVLIERSSFSSSSRLHRLHESFPDRA